jgi:hypothetical protein
MRIRIRIWLQLQFGLRLTVPAPPKGCGSLRLRLRNTGRLHRCDIVTKCELTDYSIWAFLLCIDTLLLLEPVNTVILCKKNFWRTCKKGLCRLPGGEPYLFTKDFQIIYFPLCSTYSREIFYSRQNNAKLLDGLWYNNSGYRVQLE